MDALNDGKSSGSDVLERLTQYLISPKYLPHVSWTGRGKEKERKFALSACDQLINFLVVTVNKIDRSYNNKKVVSELIYGILKRAPTKYGKTSKHKSSVAASSSSSQESSSPTPPILLNKTVTAAHNAGSLPSEYLASINHRQTSTPFTPMGYWDPRFSAYGVNVYPPSLRWMLNDFANESTGWLTNWRCQK